MKHGIDIGFFVFLFGSIASLAMRAVSYGTDSDVLVLCLGLMAQQMINRCTGLLQRLDNDDNGGGCWAVNVITSVGRACIMLSEVVQWRHLLNQS